MRLFLRQLKWAIVRCWLKNVRRWPKETIDSHLTLKQFIKHPDRWIKESKFGPQTDLGDKGYSWMRVQYYKPKESEKERWFDEKMLRRSRNDRT